MEFVPFGIMLMICGVWFYICAAKAKRSSGARWLSAFVGGVEFSVLLLIVRRIVEKTDFFYRALMNLGDFPAIMTYIVLPCLIVVFISGLLLRRRLVRSASPASSVPQ